MVIPWPVVALFWFQTSPQAMQHLKACSESLQRNEVQAAVKACKTAVAIDSQSAAAHMLLGQAYLAMRAATMVAEAKAELQQALDIDPELIWARFYLAKVYIDIGRPDKAKEELELALRSRPGVPHMLSMMGEAERKLQHPEAALELHKRALAVDPKMNTAHYYAALAWMDMKQDEEAIKELELSIQSPYVAPDMYLTLGAVYTQRKRYKEAEALCRKALALEPGRAESYLNLAQLFNAQKRGNDALGALRQALPEGRTFATSPYYQKLQADIHFEFGRAQESKGAVTEAVASYERSLALDSNRAETHRRLAELYQKQGHAARAEAHAAEAARLEKGQ